MQFFSKINTELNGYDLNITISKKDEQMIVSVLPKLNPGQKTEKTLSPVVLRGTPDEIDAGFMEAMQKPFEAIKGLQIDMSAFVESVAAVKPEKVKKEKPEKVKKPKVKEPSESEVMEMKFKYLMTAANQFEETGDFKAAIGAYNEAKEYTTKTKNIKSIEESIDSHTKTLIAGELFPDIDGIKSFKSNLIDAFIPLASYETNDDDVNAGSGNETTEDDSIELWSKAREINDDETNEDQQSNQE